MPRSNKVSKTPNTQKLKKTDDSENPSSQHGPDDDKDVVRVFVYGSLKTQCGNNTLMERIGARLLGRDSITGDFSMMSFGGFPGVVRTDEVKGYDLKTIYGELWATDEEGLASLDLLESHPNWYERRKYRTDILDRRAWMYTLSHATGYLDPQRYDQVISCIWRPTDEELTFWKDHGEDIKLDETAA